MADAGPSVNESVQTNKLSTAVEGNDSDSSQFPSESALLDGTFF